MVALLDDDPGVQPWRSVASEAPRQLDVEGVEVDIADALEQLGGWPTASAHCPGPPTLRADGVTPRRTWDRATACVSSISSDSP